MIHTQLANVQDKYIPQMYTNMFGSRFRGKSVVTHLLQGSLQRDVNYAAINYAGKVIKETANKETELHLLPPSLQQT